MGRPCENTISKIPPPPPYKKPNPYKNTPPPPKIWKASQMSCFFRGSGGFSGGLMFLKGGGIFLEEATQDFFFINGIFYKLRGWGVHAV